MLLRVYREAYSGLPRAVWVLALVALVNRSGTMVLPFLALYLTSQRGYTTGEAGAFLGVYGVGSIAGSFVGGVLSDRLGPLRVQAAALCGAGIAFVVLGRATTTAAISTVLLALAVLNEAFRPANAACLATVCPPALLTRGFALNRVAINLGCAIGPVLGGLLAVVDYAWLFVVDGATCLCAALPLAALRSTAPAAGRDAPTDAAADRSPWRDRLFLACLLCASGIGFMHLQTMSTLPLYLTEGYGFREDTVGLLFAVNPVLIVLFEMVLVHRLRERPPLPLVGLGALLIGVGASLLPLGRGFAFALVAMVVWTVGEMLESPLFGGFVAARAGPTRRGAYMGLYMLAFACAVVLAPLGGTAVYERLGPTALWLGCGGLGVVIALAFWRLAHAVAREPATDPARQGNLS
jgi:predicted MFS family arabinose efflux permease